MAKVGERAPAFRARDQHGAEVALEDLLARGAVVLYFYPHDFTPVCTAQACQFRDAYEELLGLGASIVGVSTDDESSHAKVASRHSVPFSLLADGDKRISNAYGVNAFFGLRTVRKTFLIDRTGVIRGVYHHELSAGAHVEDVRRGLRALAPVSA